MDISLLLNEIKASSRYENQIVHIEEISSREALYTPLELEKQVKSALLGAGIEALYSHQTEAIEKIQGRKRHSALYDDGKRQVSYIHGPYF